MINQIRKFETPASLYDYPCVVILKKIFLVITTISGAQKGHGSYLQFPWVRACCQPHAITTGALVHVVCFHCKDPRLREKAPSSLPRFKRLLSLNRGCLQYIVCGTDITYTF